MSREVLIEKSAVSRKNYHKYWFIILFALGIGFLSLYFILNYVHKEEVSFTCGDDTPYGNCSENKPYYCDGGNLIRNMENCGCPEIFSEFGENCSFDNYENGEKVTLNYVINGREKYLDFYFHQAILDYLEDLPRSLSYSNGENFSRSDFKLMKIDDELQREMLMPLVVEIQNLAPWSKDLQAKIAISLVQNIPYGNPDFVDVLEGRFTVPLSKYPYQTLSSWEGSCECKSELLVFLLRELGFETALFYYQDENHEAVGIKCPEKYSLEDTGFCFVETTLPAPISYSKGRYQGPGGSSVLGDYSELIIISEGESLSKNLDDYSDARVLGRLVNKVDKKGYVNYFEKKKLDNLREKYGLIY